MKRVERITVNPDVRFGKPCIRGTRITVDDVLGYLAGGARWAELADYGEVPVETSLDFLALLHAKWVTLLRRLSREQLARRFVHPDTGRATELAWYVGMYAWHGRHHLAHVTSTFERAPDAGAG